MDINQIFLKSKVARRIFFLFIFCTLLPLFIIAGITYTSVNTQLTRQASARLRQSCKLKGMEIYNKLFSLEMELKMVSLIARESTETSGSRNRFILFKDELFKSFEGLAFVTNEGRIIINILGTIEVIPELSPEELHHIYLGRTLVCMPNRHDATLAPQIFMVRLVHPEVPQSGLLVAEVDQLALWGIDSEEALISDSPIFILHPEKGLLFSSIPGFRLDKIAQEYMIENPVWGDFQFNYGGDVYLAGYWSLFLKYHFFAPSWVVIMGQAKSIVQEPTAFFTKIFFLLVLLTFFIVSLLSVILIRKSLVPIESLRVGTEKIANGEFGTEVSIKSGDEFETLGDAFNEMSKKLEQGRKLLVQSAKMSTVGEMASGIVHEIGQPLTSIYGLVELMLLKKPDEESKKNLEIMKNQVERLSHIISGFKTFARVSEEKMVPVSLDEVIRVTYELLAHQIQMKHILWIYEKEDHLPPIRGDRNMLQQVLTNLIINAMDALEGKKDVKPEIALRTFTKDDQVFIEIWDNGSGIPKEIQERIFDPFFTTKSEGKGTGLGLAIIASILHQHGAHIRLESEVNLGTKFIISFPVSSVGLSK